MDPYPKPLKDLIAQLKRLPGVGEKTATRLALFILADRESFAVDLAGALTSVKDTIRLCSVCYNLADMPTCSICQDLNRDRSVICVVEEPSDVLALESAHAYKGLYHVLHGLISPMNGIGPQDIRLPELMERLSGLQSGEVIVATNPSVEGEGTFHLIARLIEEKRYPVRVSRIASGIPMGGEVKYMDQVTLASALRYRRNVKDR